MCSTWSTLLCPKIWGHDKSLTNAILEVKVPHDEAMQRVVEVDIGKKVWLVQIHMRSITTGNEDVDEKLRRFDSVGVKLNEVSMYIVQQIEREASQEISDWDATLHDELVCLRQDTESNAEELQ